jgi:phenylalanyl-tRNA synthetase beta chain
MKISYNQLKQYIDFNYSPEELGEILTDLGLEAESIELFESVKGGMDGLVIGEVKSCEKHPNADKLSLTTVDIGTGEWMPIVCGAPNVAKGQKVVVATLGTKLYFNNEEIVIKKGKIRGETSEGMICAEDEIGIGTSHAGIMVLPGTVEVGTPAKDYFKVERDSIFEIGLTPNRADAASHIGVARDLAAWFKHKGKSVKLKRPDVSAFKTENNAYPIKVEIENKEACKRYSGVTVSGITIKESPDWLKIRLKAIGLNPINNVVDITNFVLHETGQPLHAFDADKITGKKVIVKSMKEGSVFKTLDEAERKLHKDDLMICNEQEGMCMAGVFGGIDSGVTAQTKNVFLESAYFNPVYVRRTSKRHGLQTDSSFRFERGVDPNNTLYPLKRAALLIKELAGGSISSEIVDVYPEEIKDFKVEVQYAHVDRLIGKAIDPETVDAILEALEIKIVSRTDGKITVEVPPYRVDVTREADVIEEILRIYGYNSIEAGEHVNSTLSYARKPEENKVRNAVSDFLSAQGFSEAMSNSLTKSKYYEENPEGTVKIMNALSSDLNMMRKDLLYSALEAVIRNINYNSRDIKLYEFGYSYHFDSAKTSNPLDAYSEKHHLALSVSGKKANELWNSKPTESDFYFLKSKVNGILGQLNYDLSKLKVEDTESDFFSFGIRYALNGMVLASFGKVSKKYLSVFDIEQDVWFADLNWEQLVKNMPAQKTFTGLPKYPAVKRDLALLLDKTVKYAQIEELAFRTENKILKEMSIFDVFEDEKLGVNKKSYAVSFVLQDETATLNDARIDKTMKKLQSVFERELGAVLR